MVRTTHPWRFLQASLLDVDVKLNPEHDPEETGLRLQGIKAALRHLCQSLELSQLNVTMYQGCWK